MRRQTQGISMVATKAFMRKYEIALKLLLGCALLTLGLLAYLPQTARAASACTTTVTSVSTAQSAVNSAADGAVICMKAGTYGQITLTRAGTTHSGNVIFSPDPSLDPNATGKVTFNGILVEGNYITVHNFYSTGSITISGPSTSFKGFHNITIDHNNVGPTSGYGISIEGTPADYNYSITISNNKIHDTSPSTEGDALRIDGYRDVTISGNEIYNIKETAACRYVDPADNQLKDNCHTDTLQSYQGLYHGNTGTSTMEPTSGLTLDHNYIHDNTDAQGFPFLKDGTVTGVKILDNLSVRNIDSITEGNTGMWIAEASDGIIVRNNTYQDATNNELWSEGGSPTAYIDHNVLNALQNGDYNGAGHYNFIESQNYIQDRRDLPNNSADFGGTPPWVTPNHAGDDYRITTPGIGVDWKPADFTFGPKQDNSGSKNCSKSGDFNCDGMVDSSDFQQFVTYWKSGGHSELDLNKDGAVDIRDVSIFMQKLGT